jgi:hypothetical protein
MLLEWARVEASAGTGAFVVMVDRFVAKVNEAMVRFRDIPGQDIACGVFQLVEESLHGEKFALIAKQRLFKPIRNALEIAANTTSLSIESYDKALKPFVDANLRDRRP